MVVTSTFHTYEGPFKTQEAAQTHIAITSHPKKAAGRMVIQTEAELPTNTVIEYCVEPLPATPNA